MQFPKGNKVRNPNAPIDAEFGDNIKLLEERMNGINWRRLGKFYAIGLGVFLVSIFLIIVIIRLAFFIF